MKSVGDVDSENTNLLTNFPKEKSKDAKLLVFLKLKLHLYTQFS